MTDKFNLQRFKDAQEHSYDRALQEIKNGRKTSHWMWYIFPQFKGLGRSETSKKYAIKSKEEAVAYFEDETLRERLLEITKAFLANNDKSAHSILGSPDDVKMKSCMTLFDLVQSETDIFQQVLDKFYEGKQSYRTRKMLKE